MWRKKERRRRRSNADTCKEFSRFQFRKCTHLRLHWQFLFLSLSHTRSLAFFLFFHTCIFGCVCVGLCLFTRMYECVVVDVFFLFSHSNLSVFYSVYFTGICYVYVIFDFLEIFFNRSILFLLFFPPKQKENTHPLTHSLYVRTHSRTHVALLFPHHTRTKHTKHTSNSRHFDAITPADVIKFKFNFI